MKIIQVLGIVAVLVSVLIARNFSNFKIRTYTRLSFLLMAVIGVLLFIFPNLSNEFARIAGVGRGSDLIFYFTSLGLYFLVAALIGKFREMEITSTRIVREMALQRALDSKFD